MKYFLHDSNAFGDEKITQLYIKFGYEGLGLFYTALEKFAQQEKPIKTDILKHQLKVGKRLDKCWKFMEEIGIICSLNGDSFSKQLLNYAGSYQIKKQKTAKRVAKLRLKQQNVTHYGCVSNAPKVKESKVNKNKVNKNKEIHTPTLEDVKAYCLERKNKVDPDKWHSWYTANGWKVGKNPMKDWRAAVRTWENKENGSPNWSDERGKL